MFYKEKVIQDKLPTYTAVLSNLAVEGTNKVTNGAVALTNTNLYTSHPSSNMLSTNDLHQSS